jgi:hypothetical protein
MSSIFYDKKVFPVYLYIYFMHFFMSLDTAVSSQSGVSSQQSAAVHTHKKQELKTAEYVPTVYYIWWYTIPHIYIPYHIITHDRHNRTSRLQNFETG